jgi:hypothetical protein
MLRIFLISSLVSILFFGVLITAEATLGQANILKGASSSMITTQEDVNLMLPDSYMLLGKDGTVVTSDTIQVAETIWGEDTVVMVLNEDGVVEAFEQ